VGKPWFTLKSEVRGNKNRVNFFVSWKLLALIAVVVILLCVAVQ
jgi:hypothetical protein